MLSSFTKLLHETPAAVVLLEGTRDLPLEDAPRLTAFANRLAQEFPTVTFRTGNAPGTDEAFAQGVCLVDPKRLEYIVPHASHRRKMRHPDARSISLDELNESLIAPLLEATERATPKYRYLIEQRGHNLAMKIKLDYLLRDALKVVGAPERRIAPATLGIFYVNAHSPQKGGTGHTLRVCVENHVQTWTQEEWLNWF